MHLSTFALRASALFIVATALVACHTPPPPPAKPVAPATGPGPSVNPQARFQRPAAGPIVERFNGKTNKGIDIAGQRGDPVVASAEGRLVIVSSALRAMAR